MVNNSGSIAWLKEGLIPQDKGINTWEGSGKSVSGSSVTLDPGGYIYATIEGKLKEEPNLPEGTLKEKLMLYSKMFKTSNINTEDPGGIEETQRNPLSSSRYIKVETLLDNIIPEDYNYIKGLSVSIKERYVLEEGDSFNRTKSRELMITSKGLKNVNNSYLKEHILEMLGKPLESLYIKIVNSSEESITLSGFQLYSSQDLSDFQYQQIQQGATSMFGTIIEPRLDDPINPQIGRIWLRIDL